MNERIWQLQGQAKVLAEEIVSQRKYDDYMEYKQSLMDQTMNKYAELIVQECISVVQKGGGMCGAISSNNLKQHFFGVEE